MSGPAIDLVVECLVLEGIGLNPEQAATLAELVEEELRRMLAGGALSSGRDLALVDSKPIALAQPPDLAALARTLAQRIAADAKSAGAGHG